MFTSLHGIGSNFWFIFIALGHLDLLGLELLAIQSLDKPSTSTPNNCVKGGL